MAYGYHMTDSIKTTVYLDAEDYRRLGESVIAMWRERDAATAAPAPAAGA